MSYQTYTTPESLELLKRAGWPIQWDDGGACYCLDRKRHGWVTRNIRQGTKRTVPDHHITDHEAVCLIRDYLRVWLDSEGLGLIPVWDGGGYKIILSRYTTAETKGPTIYGFDDYDEALLAAVRAALDEEQP